MSKRTPNPLAILAAGCLSFAAISQSVGALIHEYALDGTLADSLGGPSLLANGGTLNPTDYSFDPNQGLSLSNALPNPAKYSILVDFSFSSLSGYRRIIDFKDRASDTGLYDLNTAVNFFTVTSGGAVFVPDAPVLLVITRDATSGMVVTYIDGVPQISFTDNTNLAVFDAGNAIIHFFIDDLAVPNEASAGSVSEIAIFDTALSALDVTTLGGPGGAIVPEPGSGLLCLSALATCLAGRLRRRNA